MDKSSDDYTRKMVPYTKAFVVLEDRDIVIREMQMERILQRAAWKNADRMKD